MDFRLSWQGKIERYVSKFVTAIWVVCHLLLFRTHFSGSDGNGNGGNGYGKMSPDTILPPPWRHRQDKKILQPLRCVWRPLFND